MEKMKMTVKSSSKSHASALRYVKRQRPYSLFFAVQLTLLHILKILPLFSEAKTGHFLLSLL